MPRHFRRNYTNKALDKRLRAIENEEELKYLDTRLQTTATVPGVVTLVNGMIEGTGPSQRIGTEINATSLTLRYIINSQSTKFNYTMVRVMVFWASETLGGAPTLTGPTSTGTAAVLDSTVTGSTMNMPYSRQYVPDVYKVVYDKVHVINQNVIASVDDTGDPEAYIPVGQFHKKHIPLYRKVSFDSATATVTSIANNSLWVAFMADSVTVPMNFDFTARFNYKDT